ncbi:hypothetical protein C1646_700266 [Rhizophagus diaphanus]|nr:hypothetical protein C1646_700266 [Rhizophagus diaphanus] [Rhizophagus sp. MUCL 43196]
MISWNPDFPNLIIILEMKPVFFSLFFFSFISNLKATLSLLYSLLIFSFSSFILEPIYFYL